MLQVPLFFDILDHVFHFALQRVAEGIQRAGTDGQAVLDAVEGVGGKSLFVDEVILCNTLLKEGFIKRFIADHKIHHD